MVLRSETGPVEWNGTWRRILQFGARPISA